MTNRTSLEVKEITYLEFPMGKELLARYNDSIAKYGDKARGVLSRFSLGADDSLLGSNPFMAVQLGQLEGVKLATPAELETAVKQNPDFFRNKYEDIALVLRSEGDSYVNNDFLAKNIAEQIKTRLGSIPTSEDPARISLKGLSLKEDANSPYGLAFVIGDETELIYVPEFAHTNNGKSFAKTDERGVPIFDVNGSRTLYTRETGLSRLYRNGSLNLGSGDVGLADSSSGGRVPLVSSEAGVAQKITELKTPMGETRVENYTQAEIQTALQQLSFGGLETALLSKLKEIRKN